VQLYRLIARPAQLDHIAFYQPDHLTGRHHLAIFDPHFDHPLRDPLGDSSSDQPGRRR
jgi:hypothetical protein